MRGPREEDTEKDIGISQRRERAEEATKPGSLQLCTKKLQTWPGRDAPFANMFQVSVHLERASNQLLTYLKNREKQDTD